MSDLHNRIMDELKSLGDNSSARYQEILKKYEDLNEDVKAIKKKNGQMLLAGNFSQQKDNSLTEIVEKNFFNDATVAQIKSFTSGEKNRLVLEVKDMDLTTSYTGGTVGINMRPLGIVGSFNRLAHIREVMPSIQMTTGTLPIIKDNGNTGTFETVAEGGTKPTIDFALAEVGAKAEVIAGITNVTRQFLDDLGAHGVLSWLQSRLTELYLIEEDAQLLSGDGVSPNLSGVNDTGNFTAETALVADNDVVQLVKGLVQMRAQSRTPRVIVVNPLDLPRILLNTASGSGEFDLPSYVSVNNTGGISILGVPVIDTQAQTEKQFNILDTSQMLMGIREPFKIQFFEQDGDNVRKNRITVRAESRVAFATYGALNTIKGIFEV